MKVGNQSVHHAEGIARQNHELRFGTPGLQRAVGQGRTLEGTNDSGANSPDSASLRPHLVETMSEVGANLIALGMHLVLLRIVHLHRLEGAGPNLKVQALNQNTG